MKYKLVFFAIVILFSLFACKKEILQPTTDDAEEVISVYQPIDTVAWLGDNLFTYIGSDSSIIIQAVPIGSLDVLIEFPLCGKVATNYRSYKMNVPVHKIWIDTLEVCDKPIIQIAYY